MDFMKLNIQLFAVSSSISCAQVGDYNVSNNTSVERITFTVKRTSGTTFWSDARTVTFTIDGKTYTSSLVLKSSQTSASCYVDVPITHNADGTKTLSYSASIATGTSAGTVTANGTKQLAQIPRTSSFSASNTFIENTCYISINRASTAFSHNLYYSFGSLSGTIATGAGDSYAWNVPSSFYAQIPNAKEDNCTIRCETYVNGSKIGETTQTIRIVCEEAKCKPTFSHSIIDNNAATRALTDSSNVLVKYKSTAVISVTALAKNSASISSVQIDNNATTSLSITNVSKNTFNIKITDSRGFVTEQNISANMIEYVPLTISANIKRVTQTGKTVKISYSGNYFNGSFGNTENTLTMNWKYRLKGESVWSSGGILTPAINGNTYSSEITTNELFDYQKDYEFIIYATDKLNMDLSSGVISLTKGQASFEIYKDGIKLNGVFLAVEIVDEW